MNPVTIVFQGDSITDCGRSRDNDNYLGGGYVNLITARLLADRLGSTTKVYNRGISGHRVVDLYARWKIDMINLKPDVLSILIGVNDTWHHFSYNNGVEPERYCEFYQKLIDWTQKDLPATKIVLMEPFVLKTGVVNDDWMAEMDQRRAIVKKLAKQYQLPMVELQNVLQDAADKAGDPAQILHDGVHPSLAGHQIIADTWLKTAGKLL